MATGNLLPLVSASVRGLAQSAAGLGAYISSYFESTTTTPQYKSNRAWNDPINNDAKGMFRVYYQNVHGVPRDDATLGQDLEVLAAYDVGCLCLSETNLDWNRSYVKFDFLSRQRKTWKHAATTFSAIEMEPPSGYAAGGALTSTVGKWSSRARKKQPDPSGMG